MANSSIAHNDAGQCDGGLLVTALLEPRFSFDSRLWAASSLNMSSTVLISNTASAGAGICSQKLQYFLVDNDYNYEFIYANELAFYTTWSSRDSKWPEPVRGVAAMHMVNSVFHDNSGGEGWDVYADNSTSFKFGVGVNIHRQNTSVLWKRNCTIGEVPTGDGSCRACGAFSYSLSAGGSCIQCSASAQCPGGALITPLPGFWHAAGGNGTQSNSRCSLGNVTRCAHCWVTRH